MWNILGTQLGLLALITLLAFGFDVVVGSMGPVFTVVRIAGAMYLAWLGLKLWRARGKTLDLRSNSKAQNAKSYVLQGFFVLVANPKALFFFGAFIPQFIDPTRAIISQVFAFGFLFMLVGGVLDSLYALTAGRAGQWLTTTRVIWVERLSGTFLCAGGAWLLAQGSR